jgi:carbon storage regulator CsrA
MLILMRNAHEEIVIRAPNGDVIVITVLDGRTRLGFKAPLSYTIDRAEIDALKQRERA